MKPEEYRGMSDDQLELARKDVIKNIFHLRFQSATDRLETPSEIKKAKRELARILTIKRERELVKEREVAKKTSDAKATARQDAWKKGVADRKTNKVKERDAAKAAKEAKAAAAKKPAASGKKKEKKDGSAK